MPQQQGWVSLLARRMQQHGSGYQVINASITGDTTHGGLARLPKVLAEHKPSIVIIELGGNDGLRGLDLDVMKSNLLRMVSMAREQNAKVLLLGVMVPENYGPVFGQAFHSVYLDLAKEAEVPLVPFFLEGVAETMELMQADGIHPAAEGQPRMLENVWRGLVPLFDE